MSKKRNIIATSLAVVLAVALLAGGTIAYLTDESEAVTNTFTQNNNGVELTETTGGTYDIVPGTSQDKDPIVIATYTLDSYVFVEVTDSTVVNGVKLVDYAIESGWTLLSTTDNSDGSTTYVYYQLLTADGRSETVDWVYDSDDDVYVYAADSSTIYIWDQNSGTIILQGGDGTNLIGTVFYSDGSKVVSTEQSVKLSVLMGDEVSYPDTLTNDDMSYADAVSLTFQAYIIQKDPFNDPSAAWAVLNGATYVAVKADENTTLAQALTSAVSAASADGTTIISLPEDSEISETYETKSTLINASSDIVLDLNGSEISVTDSSTSSSKSSIAVNGNGYDVTLANGEINFIRVSSPSGSSYAALQTNKGDLTLDNMKVTYTGVGYCVSTRTDGGNVVVNDTTITSSTEGSYALYVGAKSTATVSGNSMIVGCIYLANCSSASSHTCLTITGGDFTEATFKFDTCGSVLVSGGTFAINLSENSHFKIADGYEVVTNGNGTYTVSIAD